MHSPALATLSSFLVGVCLSAGGALAAGKASISTKWSPASVEPASVAVQGFTSTLPLTLDTASQTYSGSYDYQAVASEPSDVTLIAQFPGGVDLSLPLRVRPDIAVATTLYIEQPKACTRSELGLIDQSSDNINVLLQRYFMAKAALEISGDESCGDIMKKMVTKAWFDRSYDLASKAIFYRLSDLAAEAYRAYDKNYVEAKEKEKPKFVAQYMYTWQNEALLKGASEQARAVNKSLIAKLEGNTQLQEAVKESGITLVGLKNVIKLAPAFNSTVVVTDPAGQASTFKLNPDGTVISTTPNASAPLKGHWTLGTNGQLCVSGMPGPGVCPTITPDRKVGDAWVQHDLTGQQIKVQLRPGI